MKTVKVTPKKPWLKKDCAQCGRIIHSEYAFKVVVKDKDSNNLKIWVCIACYNNNKARSGTPARLARLHFR